MLSRQDILDLITEEKDRYHQYCSLCQHFKTSPDPLASAIYQSKIEAWETVIKKT